MDSTAVSAKTANSKAAQRLEVKKYQRVVRASLDDVSILLSIEESDIRAFPVDLRDALRQKTNIRP